MSTSLSFGRLRLRFLFGLTFSPACLLAVWLRHPHRSPSRTHDDVERGSFLRSMPRSMLTIRAMRSRQSRCFGIWRSATRAAIEANEALGSLYAEAGDLARALPSLERSCALAPRQALAHANLGAAYLKLGGAMRRCGSWSGRRRSTHATGRRNRTTARR